MSSNETETYYNYGLFEIYILTTQSNIAGFDLNVKWVEIQKSDVQRRLELGRAWIKFRPFPTLFHFHGHFVQSTTTPTK